MFSVLIAESDHAVCTNGSMYNNAVCHNERTRQPAPHGKKNATPAFSMKSRVGLNHRIAHKAQPLLFREVDFWS
jgi:hypothetical protein